MLEIGKAACFMFCILALCRAALEAFFDPGARFEDKLLLAGLRLGFAAWVCVVSGFIFTLPIRGNPDRGRRLSATLPVRFFFWSAGSIAVLFLTSWYLTDLGQQASPYLSSR
jgi:hypothetical protein